MTIRIPTSGTGRRRAKAIRNRQAIEVAEAFRTGSVPRSAIAASYCTCGRRSWLMPGATDEDYRQWDLRNADHDAYCGDTDFETTGAA